VGTDSAGIGDASGSVVATRALAVDETGAVVEDAVVEDAFAVVFAAEVGAAAAESEVGVDAEAGVNPRPSLTRAMADDPKKANNMAAMATLTSLPLT